VSVTASSIRVPLAVDEGSGVVLTSHLVIAASDPGAIGSGNFWLNPDVSGGSYGSPLPQLHVRNETDDDWYVVTAPIDGSSTGSQFIATTGADAYELSQSGTSIQMRSGDAARKIQVFSDGIEIKSDGYILISDGLPTSDPGAGHAGELFTEWGAIGRRSQGADGERRLMNEATARTRIESMVAWDQEPVLTPDQVTELVVLARGRT
jgi:hypothetical protein